MEITKTSDSINRKLNRADRRATMWYEPIISKRRGKSAMDVLEELLDALNKTLEPSRSFLSGANNIGPDTAVDPQKEAVNTLPKAT